MTPKANLHEKDEYIEFLMSTNLYSEPDKLGRQKLLKKNILTKVSIYIDDIQGHEEVFDKKGKVLPSYCRIYHVNMGPLVIKQSYKRLSEMKEKQHEDPAPSAVGFNKL